MLVTDVGMVTLVTFVLSTLHIGKKLQRNPGNPGNPAHEPSVAPNVTVTLAVPSGMVKCKPPSSGDGAVVSVAFRI